MFSDFLTECRLHKAEIEMSRIPEATKAAYTMATPLSATA